MGTLVNGIKEIFATSQSTATHLPVCASDGTPQGRISVGDLASVLGGLYVKVDYPNNIDEISTTATYRTFAANSGGTFPSGYETYRPWFISTIIFFDGGRVQYAYSYNNRAYTRFKRGKDSWSAWQEINFDMPTFYKNYQSLNDLFHATGDAQGRLFQTDQNVEAIRVQRNTQAGVAIGFYNANGLIGRFVVDPNAKVLKFEVNIGGATQSVTIASWT